MKKRLIAMFLALVMVVCQIPVQGIKAFAATTESGFEYTVNGSDVTITGYSDKTITSIVVPETIKNGDTTYNVVAIADYAFSWDKYPNLTDIAVRGNNVTIGQKICGFDNTATGSRNDNVVLWGKSGSTFEAYATSNGFTFNTLTTSMTEITTDTGADEHYTGREFKIYTYIRTSGTQDAKDIVWESEDANQVEVIPFGEPEKQNDGSYLATATVRIISKNVADPTCKVYAYARGLEEKKEMEITVKQSASAIKVNAKVYTSSDEGKTFNEFPALSTYYQNDIITADVEKYICFSTEVIGSDEDFATGWTNVGAEDFIEYVGAAEGGYMFKLINTTGNGYASVTFTSKSLVCSKSVNIKVTQPAEEITINLDGDEIKPGSSRLFIAGDKARFEAALDPSTSTDSVTWSSSNTTVATIAEDGTLTTHIAGNTVITCKVKNTLCEERTLSTQFNVSVLEKILYNKLGISLDVNGEAVTEFDMASGTTCKIYPIDLEKGSSTPNEPLVYTSSNPKIISVDADGNLTAKDNQSGSVTITVSAIRSDNTNATATVVVNAYVKATDINISASEQIPQGQKRTISYSLNSGATEEINWTPVDSSIAKVTDNGDGTITIEALKVGSTKIEGKSKSGGASVSIQIGVLTPIHMETMGIIVNNTDTYERTYEDTDGITVYEVAKGGKILLTPTYYPENANDGTEWIVWELDDKITSQVVTSTSLEVTAKNVGTQTFVLKNTEGKTATCRVKVIVPATKVDICKENSTTGLDILTVGLGTVTGIKAEMGSGVTDKCTWTTNNDNITLSSNVSANKEVIYITAHTQGETIITATSESGITKTIKIIVNIPATDITFFEEEKQITSAGLEVLLNGNKNVSISVTPIGTTDKVFTWSSSSGKVTIVPSEDGKSAVITGIVVGRETVKVTSESGLSKTFIVNVLQPTEAISFDISETTINKGSYINATATRVPSTANDGITYTVDKEGIVSLTTVNNNTVKITGIGVGTVTIVATTGSGKVSSMVITVVSIPTTDLSITGLKTAGYAYTGSEIKPTLTVKYGSTTLRQGQDYELRYDNNIDVTNDASVTVVGMGKYSGEETLSFAITPKAASGFAIKYVNNISSKVYDGVVYKPEIVIMDGTKTLAKGTDYDVEYDSNAIKVGRYTLTVNYKGNYSGTKTSYYSITSKPISDSSITVTGISSTGYTYTGEAIKPSITVKDGTRVLASDDYTVSYTANINASTSTAKAKITITAKGNYKGTKVVEFVIKPASISSATAAKIADKVYTGKAQKPSVSLKYKGKSVSSAYYTLQYSSNTNTGKAKITVKGKGNFTGTKYVYFNITPKAVQGLKQTSATNTSVTLTWTKASGKVSGYMVYSYNSKTKKYTHVKTTTSNKVTISKLKAGSDYKYVVCAYKKIDSKKYKGAYSSVCTAKTSSGKATIKSATSSSKGSVKLTWNAVKGATSYEIYYSSNGKKYTLSRTCNTTSVTINGLKSQKKHYFKIKVIRNINGKKYSSSYSNVKSVKAK